MSQCARPSPGDPHPADLHGVSALYPRLFPTPTPALPKEQGQRRLSSNRPLSEQDRASKEAETSLNFIFPPFSTIRSVFRSDGKGIWRDRLQRSEKGTRSHLRSIWQAGHQLSELQNTKQPWKTPQHPQRQQQVANPRVHVTDTAHPVTTGALQEELRHGLGWKGP